MEEKAEYITEAMDMLGKGYASTVIEPPRVILERKAGGEFEEKAEPAWIKFSTAFKAEMAGISGNALKVWIYLALSISYKGVAFPSIMTISKGVGISHPVVQDAIKELEQVKLITVRRGEKRYNIYEISNDYVTIGKSQPCKILSCSDETMKDSASTMKESPLNHETRVSLNKKELEDNKKQNQKLKVPLTIEGLIVQNASKEEIERFLHNSKEEKEKLDLFERAMGFNPLPWGEKGWPRLQQFLLTKTDAEIRTFAAWSRRDFSSCRPEKVRQNPRLVIDLWPLSQGKPEPELKPYTEENEENYVSR